MILDVNSTCKFMGNVGNIPVTGNVGDVCICDGKTYIFTGNKYEELSTEIEANYTDKEYVHIRPKVCTQCGANLYTKKCQYCGVEYE